MQHGVGPVIVIGYGINASGLLRLGKPKKKGEDV
jgi:hypothetical protein